ncbi:hypothetical protein EK21DRAFT_119531 [Setomelanomma holmii]|uniref:Uncharacterized protein n=1 Tax=Setomelanomma holmii TaxID=210430 RepID=A0A9P4LF05_9PLEO|nr:hypothetical protein EK21DRAFT_119531 [Setomelanomma holmii]
MSKSAASASNTVSGLEFKLSQDSRNPPSLLVTLKNNSPDTPYTILKWGTPLDTAALNIGVFNIVNEENGDEIQQFVLKINRKMPPPQDQLVTLAPGTEEELSVVFDKPWMPEKKPAKYKVKAEGDFKGVWDKYGGDVTEAELNSYIESPFSGKKFATNEVVMEVH